MLVDINRVCVSAVLVTLHGSMDYEIGKY